MTFTTNIFLFCLFPLFVVVYYLFRNNQIARKILLLTANIVFYIFGGIRAFILPCMVCLLTWICCQLLVKFKNKLLLFSSCAILLLPLLTCKYTMFVFDNINSVFKVNLTTPSLIVPIGISFFTFEALSLIADAYRGKVQNVKLFDTYLYLTFFPTVTSGPIIRYSEFLSGGGINSLPTYQEFGKYVELFIIGLGKKVLIADKIAILADYYFDATAVGNSMSSVGLWIGSIAFSLQLYYDFSGYSDMAIAIAGILGYDIPQNFDHPYWAGSIQNFWRRWHISLSTWFRDYIYIPLGGNRCSLSRHIINLLVVWLLTGIWHGADWTFVLWGLGYFVLLVCEKYIKPLSKIGNHWYGHLYTLFFVNLLWIPFRATNFSAAISYLSAMFSFNGTIEEKAVSFLPILLLAFFLCLPWGKLLNTFEEKKYFRIVKSIALLAIAILALSAVLNSTYSPYIYGNF